MSLKKLFLYCCLLIVANGCVPKSRYVWNNYDNNLYQHYKDPAGYDQFIESLKADVEAGEAVGKVPPGLYAEYGFVLYDKGNYPEAVRYFKLENDKWPESRVLMAKMINNAQMRGKQGKQPAQEVVSSNSPVLSTAISEVKGATK